MSVARSVTMNNSVRIARYDETGITNPAQHILRSPFSTTKLTYNNDTGMVIYHFGMTFGKNKKKISISTAEEFIAAITQHIPDKSFQLVRYVGWYSNRMRGDRRKQELEEKKSKSTDNEIEFIDVFDHKPRNIVHYAVSNMPGALPRTSTLALTNATLPYGLKIAGKGWRRAMFEYPEIKLGANVMKGKVTYKAVVELFGKEYTPIETLF